MWKLHAPSSKLITWYKNKMLDSLYNRIRQIGDDGPLLEERIQQILAPIDANGKAVPTRFTCADHQYIYCRLFAHCTECTEYIFPQSRCPLRTNTERKSDNNLRVIHVHPVAVFQTDVSADLVIVQDVFFEEDFNANMHRSGSRAKQFDDLHFRHPHNGGIGRQIQSAVLVYPDDVSFFFHRWSF